ncbi:MAG TPA: phosphatase domain-containing protein [Bacteriovoracaceae bacterium]|nr:phosphatase domain-containing protein [Bacteriovoracaceae bacterium]
MKNTIILLIFWALSLNSIAAITIVSDLDETIKITHSGSAVGATVNTLKKSKIFTGIPEFFQGTRSYVNKVYVLSASPRMLRGKVSRALIKNGIQHDGIILKKWTKFENRLQYKVRVIKELMENSPDDFLLLGDDVGDDPEVFDQIKKIFPGRVVEAYIHVIKDRPVPANLVRHWTAHDLGIREYAAGRMAAESVEKIVQRMKNEKEVEFLFPHFAHCPQNKTVWSYQLDTVFSELVFELNNHLINYCRSKN